MAVTDSSRKVSVVRSCLSHTRSLLTTFTTSAGYTTFGSLPGFPSIGGVPAITGWNSASCGTCWKLTYNGKSINVLGVDVAEAGTFNIALAAMNKLTNNQAKHLGRVKVTYEQVSTSDCK